MSLTISITAFKDSSNAALPLKGEIVFVHGLNTFGEQKYSSSLT